MPERDEQDRASAPKSSSTRGKADQKRSKFAHIIPPGNCCNSRRDEAGTEQTAPESGWGWEGVTSRNIYGMIRIVDVN